MLVNENAYFLGHVTHFKDEIVGNRNYGIKAISYLTDNSFCVVKYRPEKDRRNEVKSVKFYTNVTIEDYERQATSIARIARYEDGQELAKVNLAEFYKSLTVKHPKKYQDIYENTLDFFESMIDDTTDLEYHSCYFPNRPLDVDQWLFRIALKGEMNCVAKVWLNDDNDDIQPMTIKFDKTEIEVMAKEWNMHLGEITPQVKKYLDGLSAVNDGIKNIPDGQEKEKEREEINNTPHFTETAHVKKKDRIFNFSNVDIELYVIDERAVIVFQIKSNDTYVYWDLLGKEDHRLTVSAKGPFDNKLMVKDNQPWEMFLYDQDQFLEKVSMTKEDIVSKFASYSVKWMLNTRDLMIVNSGGNKNNG